MVDAMRISNALDRLQDAARAADHGAKEMATVNTADLIVALQELDDNGAWIKTVYTRELSNALRANPQQEENER